MVDARPADVSKNSKEQEKKKVKALVGWRVGIGVCLLLLN